MPRFSPWLLLCLSLGAWACVPSLAPEATDAAVYGVAASDGGALDGAPSAAVDGAAADGGGMCPQDRPEQLPGSDGCGECLRDSQCQDPGASRCELAAYRCQACRVGNQQDCAGVIEGARVLNVCHGARCVECAQDRDCPASRGHCLDNRCQPCESDAQCTGQGLPLCFQGRCGECVPGAVCGTAGLCDSGRLMCAAQAAATAQLCDPCISSLQCQAGQRCALDDSGAASCMPTAAGGCAAPFELLAEAPEYGAGLIQVCRPEHWACPEQRRRSQSCDGDSDCGPQGLCQVSGGDGVCELNCSEDGHCPEPLLCSGGSGGRRFCR